MRHFTAHQVAEYTRSIHSRTNDEINIHTVSLLADIEPALWLVEYSYQSPVYSTRYNSVIQEIHPGPYLQLISQNDLPIGPEFNVETEDKLYEERQKLFNAEMIERLSQITNESEKEE